MDLSLLIATALTLAVVVALLIWREPVLAWAQRSTVFIREVRAEVRKITWPGWDDLRRSTLVITIIVIVIGIVIGLMDWLFSRILIDFFGRAFG